jgi:hypothetical protein
MAGRRLTFKFLPNYDAGMMGQFLQAIQLAMDDLENRLKGASGGQTQTEVADTQSGGVISLTGTNNDFPIGVGGYFEFLVRSNGVWLTGLAGGQPGRIVIIKNADGSNNQISIAHASNSSRYENRFRIRNETNQSIASNAGRAFVYVEKPRSFQGWHLITEVP